MAHMIQDGPQGFPFQAMSLQAIGEHCIPERMPTYESPPSRLHPAILSQINEEFKSGLYGHQVEAITAHLDGHNICLSTSTASGKSLVFTTASAHTILSNRAARVLGLYPAKALIQDQLNKWRRALEPLKIPFTFIDGSVPVKERTRRIEGARVVLMTPDVLHAWAMKNAGEQSVRAFLKSIELLILDEAHVYDGVFGTNMAYLMRRLAAVAPKFSAICTTATIGSPTDFIECLIGKGVYTIGPERDRSRAPAKRIILAKPDGIAPFEAMVACIKTIAAASHGRFIAFGDSRRLIEQLVAAAHRGHADIEDDRDPPEHEESKHSRSTNILPYRSGYEEEDRLAIQKSLEDGTLAGVVSTSALELGIDIGEVNTVILLGLPTSIKSFWQRVGRAGRQNTGTCLILDVSNRLHGQLGKLQEWLAQPPEPNWLYLDNRYLQYANALCAANEITLEADADMPECFSSLPPSFSTFVKNEVFPSEIVPQDLYHLKQRSVDGPHLEFPLRSGIDKQFQVKDAIESPLGTLSYSQACREGYPGAIYHYMAKPYRVYKFNHHRGEIQVKRARAITTRPLTQTMVFPRLDGGILRLRQSDVGFLSEVEMQVSERVLGFTEQRGNTKTQHHYGLTSEYHQRPLIRFFKTTGICWYFPHKDVTSEGFADVLMRAFCSLCSVQERDLGVGTFHAQRSPLGPDVCQGVAIYDATWGSLRLTQRLADQIDDVVIHAQEDVAQNQDKGYANSLTVFRTLLNQTTTRPLPSLGINTSEHGGWTTVIKPGERAMIVGESIAKEVEVIGYRYTPQGLVYDLKPNHPEQRLSAAAVGVHPINGTTQFIMVDLMTGETRDH